MERTARMQLVWRSLRLDERGWAELSAVLHRADAEVQEIQRDSKARLAGTGQEAIPATFGLLGFESPPAADR